MKTASLLDQFSKKSYPFLILESSFDLLEYSFARYNIASQESADFLIQFRGQSFYSDPSDFLAHEYSWKNTTGNKRIAAQLLKREEVTNLQSYSEAVSALNSRVIQTMQKIINRGEKVRINYNGGYCPVKNLEEYQSVQRISTEEMKKFVYSPPRPEEIVEDEPTDKSKWYSEYNYCGPHVFSYDKYCGSLDIPVHTLFDFNNHVFFDTQRYSIVGYGDGSQITIRPKANTIVLLAFDAKTGEEFWFHIGE